jgi:hypothetical protein
MKGLGTYLIVRENNQLKQKPTNKLCGVSFKKAKGRIAHGRVGF